MANKIKIHECEKYMEYIHETVEEYNKGLIKLNAEQLLTIGRALVAEDFLYYAAIRAGNDNFPLDTGLKANGKHPISLYHVMVTIEESLQHRLIEKHKGESKPEVRAAIDMFNIYATANDFDSAVLERVYEDVLKMWVD
ncbi:TPA: hypothetical protein MYO72_002378 [Citrobacter freundii]|nr:hypothetical protein [Citrobacter freundii]HCB1516959.1 hypothetical protein [Citrobacter freundii]